MKRYMMLLASMLLLTATLSGCIVAPYDWGDGYDGYDGHHDGWHHGHHGGHRGYYGEGYHRY